MSGVSMMQDGSKHVYHSIALETPGPVTLKQGPRCCAEGRKIMTVLLASALLWVIVLDILLVIYRSHHLGVSVKQGEPDSSLSSRAVTLHAEMAPSLEGRNNSTFSSPTPPPLTSGNVTERSDGPRQGTKETKQSVASTGQNTGIAGITNPGRSVDAMPGLQGWLSRLRHRPQLGMTSLDRWRRPETSAGRRPWPLHPNNANAPGRRGFGFSANKHQLHGRPGLEPWSPGFRRPKLAAPELRSKEQKPEDVTAASSESSFLVRFFSAVADAPWNLTSTGGERRRHLPPPPPLPFLPGRFVNLIGRPNLNPTNIDDKGDSDETIFDIDITN